MAAEESKCEDVMAVEPSSSETSSMRLVGRVLEGR